MRERSEDHVVLGLLIPVRLRVGARNDRGVGRNDGSSVPQ